MEYLGSTMAFIVSLYLAAIVDGILVSRLLSPDAFAAINLTMPVYYARNIVFFLFVDGGVTLAAQFIGSRDRAACDKVFSLSLGWGTLILGVLGLAGWILAAPTACLLAGDSSLAVMVEDYLGPLWLTGPLLVLANGTAAYLRLEGEHRLAIAIPVVANLCNLVFDYVFIALCGWGIAGAGWATGAGYVCSLLLLVPYWRRAERNWHLVSLKGVEKSMLRRMGVIGLPMALIPFGLVVRHYAINSIAVDTLGDMGALTVSLCNAALLYAWMFADGSSTALSNVCGALYGEMDKAGALQVLRRALRLTFGLCLGAFLFLFSYPESFIAFYGVPADKITPELILYLRISLLYMLLLAHVFVMRAFYQSTRQERAATMFSLLEGVILLVPLFYALSLCNPALMWLAPALSALISLGWLVCYMRRRARKQGTDSFLMLQQDDAHDVWEASIPATIGAAAEAVLAVEEFCQLQDGLDSRQAYAAQVTVEELCVNIAEHSGLGESGHIDVFVRCHGASVVVKVRDAGKPFNPVKFLDDQGEEFSGLLMVRKLTTQIEYVRILGFNTTIVTIGKRRG
ncbi:MATE family efflux transporter [Selenomonas ruminantium]|nr:MATE family efflux transporter [Selenomonas ruminantium]